MLLGNDGGRGDSQGEREGVRRGAADPPAAGMRRPRWGEGQGEREGRGQRARPGTVGVTHGLSEGLRGGSGRDLHAWLLPGGYALPPGAMI